MLFTTELAAKMNEYYRAHHAWATSATERASALLRYHGGDRTELDAAIAKEEALWAAMRALMS